VLLINRINKRVKFFGSIDREGFYTKVPVKMTQPLSFRGEIKNEEVQMQTN